MKNMNNRHIINQVENAYFSALDQRFHHLPHIRLQIDRETSSSSLFKLMDPEIHSKVTTHIINSGLKKKNKHNLIA